MNGKCFAYLRNSKISEMSNMVVLIFFLSLLWASSQSFFFLFLSTFYCPFSHLSNMTPTTAYFGVKYYRISVKDQEKAAFTSKGTPDCPPPPPG